VQRSWSKEWTSSNKNSSKEIEKGVFEGYLLKVIDTSSFIRGQKHKWYYVLDMETGILFQYDSLENRVKEKVQKKYIPDEYKFL